MLNDLVVADIIHGLQLPDSFTVGDTNELLSQRTRSVGSVEMEEALLCVNSQEACDIFVVGEGGRQTENSDGFASLLGLTNSSADNALQYRTTVVVQQMDFIDDDKAHKIGIGQVVGLSGNNIPLLGCSDNDLSLGDLLLGELAITRQLCNPDAVWLKSLA
ncbi:hypothetical protein HG531_013461 [Fusarium graminearum]|nr:hypothetical protein HG531_013461 [Fusarium graminearum]